jgi:prophage antirepressor-like protein
VSALAKTFDFEGRAFTNFAFRGRECWIAQGVGALLGYTPAGWRSAFREWSNELIEAADFDTLRGPDLREFLAGIDVSARTALSRAPNLTILYESGLNLVCIKTEKPTGKKLRRFLAKDVIPALRRMAFEAQALHDELIDLNLRLSASEDTKTIWETRTIRDICDLYRKPWDGEGRMPQWLKQPLGAIYRIVLGETVYRELKSRNPDPRDGSLNYQFLTEARHKLMVRDMGRVTTVLRMSGSREQFFNRLRGEFGRGPRQLEMGA